jgi:CheY-like chemotaxis protein
MILLVEDDAIIRTDIAESLRSAGQGVLEAADAEKALTLLEENPITLVLLDLVLPGVDGLKLMDMIHQRHPTLPIILISGYLSQRAGDAIVATSGVHTKYFAKPVIPSALIRTVQELLTVS